jgi:hypothetical protein
MKVFLAMQHSRTHRPASSLCRSLAHPSIFSPSALIRTGAFVATEGHTVQSKVKQLRLKFYQEATRCTQS